MMGLPVGRPDPAPYRHLLANPDFRRLFASGVASGMGDWLGLFALQVLVVSLADPGSPLALFGLSGIMVARLLPSVLFGPFAGVVADRFDRKRVLIVCDVARAVAFGGIALSANLVVLLALSFVAECFTLAYVSAKNAATPVLVDRDELAEANQLNLLASYGPLPFGAAVATAMSWLAGVLERGGLPMADPTRLALWLNAATFLVAAALLVRIRRLAAAIDHGRHGRRGEDAGGALSELREGLRFIARRPLIRSLLFGVVGVFFAAGFVIALGPEFVRTTLDRGERDWYGLMTTVGFGLLAGLVAGPWLARRVGRERIFAGSLVGAGLAGVGAAAATAFFFLHVAGAVLGALVGMSFVMGHTILQARSPDRLRARAFAALLTGSRLALFASLALAPTTAAVVGAAVGDFAIGPVRVVLLGGTAVGLCSAVAAAFGMLRCIRQEDRRDGHAVSPTGSGHR